MADGKNDQPRLLRVAAAWLGLEPQVTPDSARATVLRKLRDDDYVPSPAIHEAILVVLGQWPGGISLLADELDEEAEQILVEINEFARVFFTIPLLERVERWQALRDACEGYDPPLARLRDLEPGLRLDRTAIIPGSPVVGRLIDDILSLFVLPPDERAIRSRELANRFRTDPGLTNHERSRTCRALARHHPEIVNLSPVYFRQIARHASPWMLGRLSSWYRRRANRRYLRR